MRRLLTQKNVYVHANVLALYPGSLGRGGKRAWYPHSATVRAQVKKIMQLYAKYVYMEGACCDVTLVLTITDKE